MRRPVSCRAICLLLALSACSSLAALPPDLKQLLADAPADGVARLLIDGDRIVSITVSTGGPGSMPAPVRTTLRAVVPDGETLFEGREWDPLGAGYRVDKRYRDGLVDHVRSVLVTEHGLIIERSHSVPLPQVPAPVLATGLRLGPFVDEARIVSDGEREQHWTLVVRDRSGRSYVATVGLNGQDLGHLRRLSAQLHG